MTKETITKEQKRKSKRKKPSSAQKRASKGRKGSAEQKRASKAKKQPPPAPSRELSRDQLEDLRRKLQQKYR